MNIVELQTVGSTNDHAKLLAKEGAASGTIVWAHEQTGGRGRQGNLWVSLPGNLFMSMILRPQAPAGHIGQLSFVSAVALANVLEKIVPVAQVSLKWPNDVLINRKKAAGILIETENRMSWAVVGIGVNIAHAPEGAISLHEAGAAGVTAGQVLALLAKEMAAVVESWEKAGFDGIRRAWLKRAHKLGGEITARLPKENLTGTFQGIDPTGALQLQLPDGTMRTINSGEVFI
ncbi:MAG: biotin--[acetyl-CoA-carboxylase] ligase [Alphaproteobacteria bacterium]|nr:biotin--[acetyl-CoA-carboxylase] ligase [Alphaproteobacteria bacterium]